MVELVSCHSRRGIEGARLWLLDWSTESARPRLAASHVVGVRECCSAQWFTSAVPSVEDVDGDGNDEIRLQGDFESGSDGHLLRGDAELVFFASPIPPESLSCLPFDRLLPGALVVRHGSFVSLDTALGEGLTFEVEGTAERTSAGLLVTHRFSRRAKEFLVARSVIGWNPALGKPTRHCLR